MNERSDWETWECPNETKPHCHLSQSVTRKLFLPAVPKVGTPGRKWNCGLDHVESKDLVEGDPVGIHLALERTPGRYQGTVGESRRAAALRTHERMDPCVVT